LQLDRPALEALSDVYLCTPGRQFADRVQELHIKVLHILIELIERHFFRSNYAANHYAVRSPVWAYLAVIKVRVGRYRFWERCKAYN